MKKYLALALAAALTHTACEEKQTAPQQASQQAAVPQQPTQQAAAVPEPAEKAGNSIKTVKIGEQIWMAENLNIETEGSVCYGNNPENCGKYGRLYNWQAATKACPSGWHLPTREEWGKLFHHADGTTPAEPPHQSETSCKNLKSQIGWQNNENGTDKYGFTALPSGYGTAKGTFALAGTYASWWSSTEWDTTSAHYRDTGTADDADDINYKSEYLSVRCVRD